MKLLTTLIFLAVIALGCGNPNTGSEQSSSKAEPAEFSELRLDVKGMTCEGCENAIIRSLGRLDGVYSSDASHEDDLVTIKYDPDVVDLDQITEAITKTGYNVAGQVENRE
jgi:mercuric ion transport protein